jgi:hemerythrin-like domain-containing protein
MALLKRTANSENPVAEQDAIEVLKKDHRTVAKLLDEFEEATAERKSSIANQICNALKVHAQVEEEIFYPAARAALEKDDDLIDEADVEHATIKGLVGRIEDVGTPDDHYDALVKVLGEYVKHHVKEEEQELFPKLRRSKMDLDAVGAALALRKQELEKSPHKLSKS